MTPPIFRSRENEDWPEISYYSSEDESERFNKPFTVSFFN